MDVSGLNREASRTGALSTIHFMAVVLVEPRRISLLQVIMAFNCLPLLELADVFVQPVLLCTARPQDCPPETATQ